MEFIVAYIVTGESGQHTLIGRCGDAPIHVGDEFRTACQISQTESPHTMPQSADEREVLIYVNEVQAYGQKLDELGQGMTGSLVVSGVGIENIVPGSILGSQPAAVDQPAMPGREQDG